MRATLAAVVLAAIVVAGCVGPGREARPPEISVGDVERGGELIEAYGCGSCHTVPGVRGADAEVGPPLTNFGKRAFIAGQLANTQDNMVRWLMDPQEVAPGTAMPDLDVSEEDALDIAAYLASLQ